MHKHELDAIARSEDLPPELVEMARLLRELRETEAELCELARRTLPAKNRRARLAAREQAASLLARSLRLQAAYALAEVAAEKVVSEMQRQQAEVN